MAPCAAASLRSTSECRHECRHSALKRTPRLHSMELPGGPGSEFYAFSRIDESLPASIIAISSDCS